ncbi:MAG: ArnT family glycosyltransferase, partial [Candidatus Latescibacterota bacterium]
MKNKLLISDWVLMGLLGLFYLSFVGYLLPIGSDDLRMTNVFSIDESDIVMHVWNVYVTDFNLSPSFKYGGVFYLIPVGMLHVWSIFFDGSEQAAVIAVRLYCSLAGVGCLWLTYLLGRLIFQGMVGVLAAYMLGLNPTFLRWAIESHPDLPQLFFLLISLFFICRYVHRPILKNLIWASLGAGLAFATKYAGIFLMPVLALAVYQSFPSEGWFGRLKLRTIWVHWGVLMGVFCGIFLLTNPSVLTHFTLFVSSLQSEKEIMAFGHRVRDPADALLWLQMVVTQVGVVPM